MMNHNSDQEKLMNLLLEISKSFSISNDATFMIFDSHHSQLPAYSKKEMLMNMSRGNESVMDTVSKLRDGIFSQIVGNIPILTRSVHWVDKNKKVDVSFPEYLILLYKSLFLLRDDGVGLYYVLPNIWSSNIGKKFIEELESKGYYINFSLQIPDKFIEMTSVRFNVVAISRKKADKTFFASLSEDSDINTLAHNYENNQSSNLNEGIFIKTNKFLGFERYKSELEFIKLSQQYKQFKKILFKDLVLDIKTKDLYEDDGSIYLRLAGNFKSVDFDKLKPNNYLQLVLDPKKVNVAYLSNYINSEVGQKFLNALGSGAAIQSLRKNDLLESYIYIPDLKTQEEISSVHSNIILLEKKLATLKKEITLNPNSCDAVGDETNKLLKSLKELSETDRILSIIRSGESDKVEFKQTLRKNIHTNEQDKEMEKSVLKTICGFLNKDGGTLLVGVKDDGEIFGIENDIYKDNDHYSLHFTNLFKKQIGANFLDLVSWKIIKHGKQILVVECKRSQTPVWLNKESFYTRSNPATLELKGEEQHQYIQKHFK